MSQKTDRLTPNQDEFYAALMAVHEGLDEQQSHALNARLVLLLANALGDVAQLEGILEEARRYDAAP